MPARTRGGVPALGSSRIDEKIPQHVLDHSREHCSKLDRGNHSMLRGRDVELGDNAKAWRAWERYTGRCIECAFDYGARHVGGCPWDPYAFAAGHRRACAVPWARAGRPGRDGVEPWNVGTGAGFTEANRLIRTLERLSEQMN